MNFDQRQSFRIQIPEGRELAAILVGGKPVSVRILDESAGGFAVALLGDVDIQENEVHVLKAATGRYETRVARIEHFSDGKLLGLVRLKELSAACEEATRVASWRDNLFVPQQSPSVGQIEDSRFRPLFNQFLEDRGR